MWTEWSIAQIAIVVSIGSFLIALASFVWNVWSKFVFPKAQIRVAINLSYVDPINGLIVSMLPDGSFPGEWKQTDLVAPSIQISATNFGPGDIILAVAIARKSKLIDRSPRATGFLNPYNSYPADLNSNGPYSGGLQKRLGVGEQFSVFFPIDEKWITKEKLVRFGFLDSFGRKHFASRTNMREFRRILYKVTKATPLIRSNSETP